LRYKRHLLSAFAGRVGHPLLDFDYPNFLQTIHPFFNPFLATNYQNIIRSPLVIPLREILLIGRPLGHDNQWLASIQNLQVLFQSLLAIQAQLFSEFNSLLILVSEAPLIIVLRSFLLAILSFLLVIQNPLLAIQNFLLALKSLLHFIQSLLLSIHSPFILVIIDPLNDPHFDSNFFYSQDTSSLVPPLVYLIPHLLPAYSNRPFPLLLTSLRKRFHR